eukprot:138313-Pleurochrysis_carterae.AAC.1
MTQASLISNVTHHRWGGADDNKTPHERKTGRQPSVQTTTRPRMSARLAASLRWPTTARTTPRLMACSTCPA